MKTSTITLALLTLCATAHAATVYQCIDANNKTTLTDQPCPGEGRKIETRDYKASTETLPQKRAPEEQHELQRRLRDTQRKLREARAAVTAPPRTNRNARNNEAENNSPCVFIDSTHLRRLKIRHQIKLGMKSSDVRAALGPPLSINRSSYGSDQWVYDGRYLYMKNGCLEAWN